MQNLAYQSLLELILHQYGYDFTNYAKPSLYRRIDKFISEHQIESVNNLQHIISQHQTVFQQFIKELTVNVTELFRDPLYYKFIRDIIIPRLASYPIINIWHAGCSTGEEVFSMCILLKEAGLLKRSRIYATDINASNLEKAKQGIIALRSMRDYTLNYQQSGGLADFSEYYTAKYDMAMINESIRSSIIFSQHNLVSDHPFNEFQLIMCRNVMIYFNRILQERVLNLLHNSLSPLGYLGIGVKETLDFSSVQPYFEPINKNLRLYKRIV